MNGTARITNDEFGAKVGCDFTMASRLRNGKRLPSRELLENIVAAYHLDANEALAATRAGADAFKEFLRVRVFEVEQAEVTEPDETTPDN